MRRLILAASLAVLACSPAPQAPAPATDTQTQAAPGAPEAGEDIAEQQARVARLAAPYNAGDYQAGRRAFAQCRSCHTIGQGEPNRVGPNLFGLFGREVGSAQGFSYSQALQSADFTWDGAQLDSWLSNPREFLPGNRMAFAGVRAEAQRRDLIAYLMVETAAAD